MSQAGTVFIRADGSKAIGMGHLNRAFLIAGMLERKIGFKTKVLMREDPMAKEFVQKRGLDVITFSALTVKEEISFLQELASRESPRLFFLDVLENDTDPLYLDCLRRFRAPVVAITDDSFRRVIKADLVINGNPAQIGQDYSGESGKYLLGPQYFLMDESYAGVHLARPGNDVGRILVTLGASDHNDLMFKLLDVLKNIRSDFSLIVVVSSACGYVDKLKDYLAKYKRKSDLYVDVPTLAPFWNQADAAITAGGNTLFERIAARVPGITICQLKRQNEIADAFEKLGINKNLGFGPELSGMQLRSGIESFLYNAPSRIAQFELCPQYVDGKGLRRLGEELNMILKGATR